MADNITRLPTIKIMFNKLSQNLESKKKDFLKQEGKVLVMKKVIKEIENNLKDKESALLHKMNETEMMQKRMREE